jgi:hypothetical protein
MLMLVLLILGIVVVTEIMTMKREAYNHETEEAMMVYYKLECAGSAHESVIPAETLNVKPVVELTELTFIEHHDFFSPVCDCGTVLAEA